ncbi:MAG: hypothetical protein O7B25_16155 [Gammaproteobacteria bacterium]|nr:hypothetical protein [Gammaproteobacteria bacterium]
MDEAYRLVFRGELLDGQHLAVVKKRLVDALKLSDEQAERLFSRSATVVKRHADAKTAARYQRLFKKAGARLRAMPVEDDDSDVANPATPAPGIQVLPFGADILRSDERRQDGGPSVDTSHLGIEEGEPNSVVQPPGVTPVGAPDFSLAEVGADLVDHVEPEATVDIDPQFDLAEVGAIIPTVPVDRTPAVDMSKINFDLAEPGADIGVPRNETEEPVPDTSHLDVVAP